jgi:nicotinamide-nucleotide adenylyltransferase
MRALYVGRFQPFHNGHLEVVRHILGEADELIIAIGSAQESHSVHNPFTAGERFEMIRATMVHEGFDLSKIYIVPVEDVKRNAIWVTHVRSLVPKFEMVFTNEPLANLLFDEAGFDVRKTPLFSRSDYSSTNVRKAIVGAQPWEHLVPEPVRTSIESIGGINRLMRIHSSDTI